MENINVTNVTLPSARNMAVQSNHLNEQEDYENLTSINMPMAKDEHCECGNGNRNEIIINNCDTVVCQDLGDFYPDSEGCILELSLTLRNVCRGRRIVAGILLSEVDRRGEEFTIGFRTFEVSSQETQMHDDIEISGIRFIIPGNDGSNGQRKFVTEVISHYIDFNTNCSCV